MHDDSCSKEGHDHHKEHGHKKEMWHALKDESMPAAERISKLEELKDHLEKKIEKITSTLDELKKQ